MKKFNLDDYKGNYVMHCDTVKKARAFCEFLHKAERRWITDEVYRGNTRWRMNKEKTVYYFNRGTYGSVDRAKEDGYIVLEFDYFNWNDVEPEGDYIIPLF